MKADIKADMEADTEVTLEEVLEDLGLTHLEIKIYKMLLYEGPNTAGILSRKTGIHRRNTYDALERLIHKGLVSYISENNKRQYAANGPEIVLEKIRLREKGWSQLIPSLKKHISLWKDKKETLFFRGVNGIKHVFLDQISVGKEILVEATNADVSNTAKYFFPKYQLLRKEKKIATRMIFDASYKKKANKIGELPLCMVRYIKKFNSNPVSHYIYGGNTAIIAWGGNPFAILIREKEIADAQREKFELLWKMGQS